MKITRFTNLTLLLLITACSQPIGHIQTLSLNPQIRVQTPSTAANPQPIRLHLADRRTSQVLGYLDKKGSKVELPSEDLISALSTPLQQGFNQLGFDSQGLNPQVAVNVLIDQLTVSHFRKPLSSKQTCNASVSVLVEKASGRYRGNYLGEISEEFASKTDSNKLRKLVDQCLQQAFTRLLNDPELHQQIQTANIK